IDTAHISLISRHDALPIYPKFKMMGSKQKESQEKFMKFLSDFQQAVETQQVVVAPTQDDYDINENKSAFKGFNIDEVSKMERIRSEEHTSELQSRFDLVCR